MRRLSETTPLVSFDSESLPGKRFASVAPPPQLRTFYTKKNWETTNSSPSNSNHQLTFEETYVMPNSTWIQHLYIIE